MIPLGLYGAARPMASGATLDYIGTISATMSTTTHTFTGVDIGAASASRTVLVIASLDNAGNSGTRGITSLASSGGTLTTDIATTATAATPILIARGAWATGTTADFTMTASAAAIFSLSVYAIAASVSPTDAEFIAPASGSSGSETITLTTTPGGFILGGFGARGGQSITAASTLSKDFTNIAVWHGSQTAGSGSTTDVSYTGLNTSDGSSRFAAAAYA